MEERTKNLCHHPCFAIRVVFNWQENVMQINTSVQFFFKRSMWEMLRRDRDLQTMNAVKQ
jgi:hypothetical protein